MAAPVWGAGGGANGNASSYTISVTPANSNRVLYGFVTRANTTAASSVVFNTTETMTLIASGTYNGAAAGWWVYRLIAPTATTANVVFTFGAAANGKATAFWYYDVDQTTPNGTEDEAEGSGTAVQNTFASAVGETAIAMVSHISTSTHTEVSGETERLDPSTSDNALYELAGDTSLSFDVTLGTSRAWVCVCLSLKPVAGGAATIAYRRSLLGVGP